MSRRQWFKVAAGAAAAAECGIELALAQTTQIVFQSHFFKDDEIALSIAAGNSTRSMDEFDLLSGVHQGDTMTFAYKVISALRQIGYVMPYWLAAGDRPQMMILNKFQKDHELDVTTILTKELILKLDELLALREAQDAMLPIFPLFSKFAPPPLNEPPNDHLSAIISLALSSLPEVYRPWTETNFKQSIGQLFPYGDYISLPNGDYQLAFSGYHSQLGFFGTNLGPLIWIWLDDYSYVATILHEYAHYLDGSLYPQVLETASGIVQNTREFYNFSFDVSTEIRDPESGWLMYQRRTNDDSEFTSSYAHAWSKTINGKTYHSAYEDFAESFGAYILHGIEFRELAKTNEILAKKYQWLKENVFQGREFQTGNKKFRDFFPGASRPFNVIDYERLDPTFIWDYKIPIMSEVVPPNSNADIQKLQSMIPGGIVVHPPFTPLPRYPVGDPNSLSYRFRGAA